MKYIEKPDKYSSQSRVVQLILENYKDNLVVCDVGCSGGFLAKRLQGKKVKMTGLDNDKDAAGQALPYYQKIFICDLDEGLPKLDEKFDIIVLADVLEHLKNPETILKGLSKYLKDDGFFIVSLPNIANITIRLSLLLGKFNYANLGILDKTHLRFFTLETAKKLFNKTQLSVNLEYVTPIPLPIIHHSFSESGIFYQIYRLLFLFTNYFKTLLAYQFIFTLKKNHEL
ncbi:MAG TPA: class I SAM-dependent methyltransferase [Patescibacteria group bacterium]